MVKRWEGWRNPWDREYAKRGALWRGVSPAIYLREWLSPGTRVLDLGCGDGKFLQGLTEGGFAPVGVDFARKALVACKERGAYALVQSDVVSLPFRNGSLPAVAGRFILGALLADGRMRAAREIARVLAPGAVVIIEEFSTNDFRHGDGTLVEPGTFERNQGITTHYFGAGEIPAVFPEFTTLHESEVKGTQKTGVGMQQRRRWRWVGRNPPEL